MSSMKYHYLTVVKIVHSFKIGITENYENCECTYMQIMSQLHAVPWRRRGLMVKICELPSNHLYTALLAQFFQTFVFHYMITLAAYALIEASFPEKYL